MDESEVCFCTICGCKANTYQDLLNHYKVAHINFCQICRSFPNDRLEHILYEHRQIPCEECYYTFRCSEDYRIHYGMNHSIACLICNQKFSSLHSKEEHFELVHRIKCELCSDVFNTEYLREQHCKAKHSLTCNFCKEYFQHELNLKLHHQSEHQFQCCVCEKYFDNQEVLDLHTSVAHPIPKYNCGLCNESFETKELQLIHYQICHAFECEICQKIFPTQTKKLEHFGRAHQVECYVCNDSLKSTKHLIRHYNEVHLINCPQCEEIFEDQDSKCEHIRSKHSFKCFACDDLFSTDEARTHHSHVAHQSKCNNCEGKLISTSTLDLDSLNFRRDYGFHCHICDKSFQMGKYRRELYNTEGIFNCNLCFNSYETVELVKSHYRSFHKVKYNKVNSVLMEEVTQHKKLCSQCDEVFDNDLDLVAHYSCSHVHLCGNCNEDMLSTELLEKHRNECKGTRARSVFSSNAPQLSTTRAYTVAPWIQNPSWSPRTAMAAKSPVPTRNFVTSSTMNLLGYVTAPSINRTSRRDSSRENKQAYMTTSCTSSDRYNYDDDYY